MGSEADPDPDEYDRRREEEYQMQLFGLTSRIIYNGAKEVITNYVDRNCRNISKSIVKKKNPNVATKEILTNNIKDLNRVYKKNMQQHFKRLENFTNKFICVPKNVLLEGDELQAIQYSEDEFHKLEKQLENLQHQAKRVTIFKAALSQELETTEKIKDSEELAKKLCNCVDKVLSAKKLSNKTVRAIEKNKELTELLDSIKPQTENDIYNPIIDESELNEIFLNT